MADGAGAAARIHPTAIVEDGVELGANTSVWDHAHLRSGARVGRDCIVGGKAYLAYDVVVGDRCKLNASVYLCAGTVIEDGVMVAAHVVFTNDCTPRAAVPDLSELLPSTPDETTAGTTVRRGATIGANATVGPGLEIGEFAMVGMGAVVTRDVSPFALVVGNPARLAGIVDRTGRIVWRGEKTPAAGTRFECAGGGAVVVGEDGVVGWRP